MGPIEERIREKIPNFEGLTHWVLVNESHGHAHGSQESHFLLTLVSESFQGMPLVKRHQKIFSFLKDEVAQIHAFSMQLFTPKEWEEKGGEFATPACIGKKN